MFAAYPYGNDSVCFRAQPGNTEKTDETTRAETLYCIFHVDPPARPPPTRNVASVTLRIRASDLRARHQRVVTDQVHAKKSGVQQPDRLTHLRRSSFHVRFLAERHAASVLFKSANMMAWLKHTAVPTKRKKNKKQTKFNKTHLRGNVCDSYTEKISHMLSSLQCAINTPLAYMWKRCGMV